MQLIDTHTPRFVDHTPAEVVATLLDDRFRSSPVLALRRPMM